MPQQAPAAVAPPCHLEVYFDGACPLCSREVAFLRGLDRPGRLHFTDIAAEGFDAAATGLGREALMDRIHARLADGTVVEGVEVFRRLYAAVGYGWLVAPTRLWGVRQLLDAAYRVFARNRLRLTGRCADGRCAALPR
jgi:predicted DCC family thiol-disulfide oxidoreductase YuxK